MLIEATDIRDCEIGDGPRRIVNISKTSKCLISLNLLEKKKKVLNTIIFKKI